VLRFLLVRNETPAFPPANCQACRTVKHSAPVQVPSCP
jgi:hypothetical protein